MSSPSLNPLSRNPSGEKGGAIEHSPQDLKPALDRIVLGNLKPFSMGACCAAIAVGLINGFRLPAAEVHGIVTFNFILFCAFLALHISSSRGWIQPQWANVALTSAIALAVANILFTFSRTHSSEQAYLMAVAILVSGSFLLSTRWLLGSLGVMFLAWLFVVEWFAESPQAFLDFNLPVIVALILSVTIHNSRLNTHIRLEKALAGGERELAERRQAEKQLAEHRNLLEKANQAKIEFLANMSHELRTPINGILGLSEMMLKSEAAAPPKRYTEIINTSSENLLKLIDDILDYSKIEAGQLAFEETDFHLADVLKKINDQFTPDAEAKNIKLEIEAADHLPTALRGDPSRLHQVLLNLVGNGLKFTQQGRICLRVERKAVEGDTFQFKFSVTDTGIGIPPEVQEKLFTPFMQADSSATRRFGGTGLGLAISQRIIKIMGGKIHVESVQGLGSTFAFSIPFKKARKPPSRPIEIHQVAAEVKHHFGLYRLLLAEDDPVNRMVALHQVKGLGYQVDAVENGLEALRALERKEYDLILMDCQMPELDGYETTRRIRQLESDSGRHVPIIAVTAHALKGDRDKCLAAGMDDYISKPYREERLASVMAHWLNLGALQETSGRTKNEEPEEIPPALDQDAIEAIRKLGMMGPSSTFSKIVQLFREQQPPRFETMQEALAEGNAELLGQTAHSMISSAGSLGAFRLSHLCKELKESAEAGSLAICARRFEEIREEYERVVKELEVLLAD